MAARNARNRKQPVKYVPSMQGNKYQVALAQITTSLGTSETSMAYAAETLADPYKGKTPLPRVPNYQEPFAACHPNTWNAKANQYLEQSPETHKHRMHSFPPIATE